MRDEVAALRAEVVALTLAIRELTARWQCAAASGEGRHPRAARASDPLAEVPPGFAAFWNAYACARRRNKPAALAEWRRLGCEKRFGEVMTALGWYQDSRQWREGYMKEPARWLKSQPWHDAPTPEAPAPVESDPWEVKR